MDTFSRYNVAERPLRVGVGAGEGSGRVFLSPSGRDKDPDGSTWLCDWCTAQADVLEASSLKDREDETQVIGEERNLSDWACKTVEKGFKLSLLWSPWVEEKELQMKEAGKVEGCKGHFDIPA